MAGKQLEKKDEILEVEVYIKVFFHVNTWDGRNWQHEVEVNGNVKVGDLKKELQNELGDPALSDWIVSTTQARLSDDDRLYNNVGNDEIVNVMLHQPIAA